MIYIVCYDACHVVTKFDENLNFTAFFNSPSNEYEQTNLSKVAIKTAVELGMNQMPTIPATMEANILKWQQNA